MALNLSRKKWEKLMDEAEKAVDDAFQRLLFHAFGQRLYTDLSREEQGEWDQLFDNMYEAIREP